jgi:hypothetical protein
MEGDLLPPFGTANAPSNANAAASPLLDGIDPWSPGFAAPIDPPGALVAPTTSNSIRSALDWLQGEVNGSGTGQISIGGQLQVGGKLNELLDGRSPASLTDRQTLELYRDLLASPAGAALAREPQFLAQLADRFSRPLDAAEIPVWQARFDDARATLGTVDSKAGQRALAHGEVRVYDPASRFAYSEEVWGVSGKHDNESVKLPEGMHGMESTRAKVDGQWQDQTIMPYDVFATGRNNRMNEAEAALFNQLAPIFERLEEQGVLEPGARIDVDVTVSKIACPSCAANVPEWLATMRDDMDINVNVRYLPD